MKKLLSTAVCSLLASGAYAHVSDVPAAEHAIEHLWLLLALVPAALLLPLLRGRR